VLVLVNPRSRCWDLGCLLCLPLLTRCVGRKTDLRSGQKLTRRIGRPCVSNDHSDDPVAVVVIFFSVKEGRALLRSLLNLLQSASRQKPAALYQLITLNSSNRINALGCNSDGLYYDLRTEPLHITRTKFDHKRGRNSTRN